MLTLPSSVRVYLAVDPVNMHLSFDRLAGMVRQLGLDPTLMAAANSSGGVMGKMIDAQSIVVAGTVTRYEGREGEILRYVFFHSVALAALVGLLVTAQAHGFLGG